ncbi:DNA translocase FtsK [Fundicoccus culcitae]|uniref:DNA translocase FtsK n=1 Tax=Fundicoccus culcitae TaxID=2969821 RepID=A0ABY5P755_9LACT|nr:DNA translocase FtsK [Fundicoccus culcitae]UUX34572.1 DNA translocase FtsK [Fundicoccus culcitae]
MSNKKTTTQSKRTKTKTGKKRQSSNYQVTYLVLGIFISFFAVIGLFNWGFLGLLVANSIRLFVGEAYVLVLVSFLYLGLLMIFSGKIFTVDIKKLFGFILVISSISTVLHFQQFHTPGEINTEVFQETFAIFRNELLTSQNRFSLGGGLLGSLLYSGFAYLFGFWGAHIFLVIIFFIGLFMMVGVTIPAFQQSVKDIWSYLMQGFRHIKQSFKKASQTIKSEKPAPSKKQASTAEQLDIFESVEEDIEPQQPKTSHSVFRRLRNTMNDLKPINTPAVDKESAYQPIKLENEKTSFEPFDESDPYASTASDSRELFLEGKTLDLDYFDEANHLNKPSVIIENKPPESQMHVDTNIEAEVIENHPVSVKKAEEVAETQTSAVDLDITALDNNSASHWQDQANEHQSLTSDALEKTLTSSDEMFDTQGKKTPPKLKTKEYQLPPKSLLNKIPPVDQSEEYARINKNIVKLEKTFESFGVNAKIVKANLGPSVTKYEVQPAIGVKVSKIVSLSDDIALALAARDVRIEAPIPGKSLIGIEVPNTQISTVSFGEIIDAALASSNLLEVPLGRDISGTVCLADLSKMPHLLIAGATGSGKSVGMNVIIVSLLMKAKPEEVKFLMIDPKKVELTMYDGIPHLLAPVVTNPRKAAQALNKIVQEMERRYELFAASGVRNIDSYNENFDQWNKEEGLALEPLPKIVVFIDELADLMMVASNDVENAIIRLAQMARAAGIHMIIATQRPSVDVITGIIKANVPSRLAFAVSSGTDSRTILDSVGAEKLLGHGDMLFQPMGKNKPIRVQGAYISDREVERITDFIKEQRDVDYDENILISEENEAEANVSDDEYYPEAVEMLYGLETISISQLQRKFRIGYNRAARLVDDLEAQGLVSEQDGSKPRQVLVGQMALDE